MRSPKKRVDQLLSERSLKFYNGTYEWDDEGFKDERGVYRSYDIRDPEARPPTPLPPMHLSDVEGGGDIENAGPQMKSRWSEELGRHLYRYKVAGSASPRSPGLEIEDRETPSRKATTDSGIDMRMSEEATEEAMNHSSPLSDCPSDLSEWNVEDWVKHASSPSSSQQPTISTRKQRKQKEPDDDEWVPESEKRNKRTPKKNQKRQSQAKQASSRRLTNTK